MASLARASADGTAGFPHSLASSPLEEASPRMVYQKRPGHSLPTSSPAPAVPVPPWSQQSIKSNIVPVTAVASGSVDRKFVSASERFAVVHPAPDPIGRGRIGESTAIAPCDPVAQIWHHRVTAYTRNHRVIIVTAPDLAFQTFDVDFAAGDHFAWV